MRLPTCSGFSAMTARPREMIKPVATPRNAATEMRALIGDEGKVGILFGPERKGLDNDDVAAADTVIQAPSIRPIVR